MRALSNWRRVGLPILASSDASRASMHGRNYMELACLVNEGLSLGPGTAHGFAKVFGFRAGVIAPDRPADLLLFDQDVIAEPKRSRHPRLWRS